jgi:uncharacterized membrane protein YhhN
MLIIILTALIICAASITIRAEQSGSRRVVYVAKPLTVVLIILVALQSQQQASATYQWLIVAGLLCSLAGDVFLMLPRDRFLAGLSSFFVAHLCYIAAFGFAGGLAPPAPPWSALPFLLYGGAMLRLLWRGLGKLKAWVVLYVLVISLMAWLASARWLAVGGRGSLPAFAGALLFVASDSVLAINRFKGRVRRGELLILGTYFAAQWLIALST